MNISGKVDGIPGPCFNEAKKMENGWYSQDSRKPTQGVHEGAVGTRIGPLLKEKKQYFEVILDKNLKKKILQPLARII